MHRHHPSTQRFERRLPAVRFPHCGSRALPSRPNGDDRLERLAANRDGSVLIVVIGLLLLLMLVGLTFFTFTSQEQASAEYFADSAKVFDTPPNVDVMFDFGMEQLIIGPWDNNQQSVLWPGRGSLVPNMLGWFGYNPNDPLNSTFPTAPTDRHPFNGGWGVNVISGLNNQNQPNGAPAIDQNHDGIPDPVQYNSLNYNMLLWSNWSPAATIPAGYPNVAGGAYVLPNGNPGPALQNRQGILNDANIPQIDVGYTYPDINNVFLAHFSVEPTTGMSIVTPSFHRPQYLRDFNNGSPLNSFLYGNPDWFNSTGGQNDTTARVMRPHPAHVCVLNSNFLRYITGPGAVNALGNPIAPFPFRFDANNNGTFGEEGIWSNVNLPGNFDYDVDNDGDGINEGVWLDLNFPMVILADGRKTVAMFSYTVLDADSLINANIAGNLSGWFGQNAITNVPFTGPPVAMMGNGPTTPISRSNLGLSPTEINPLWALTANPYDSFYLTPANNQNNGPSPALQQYRGFFGRSNTNSSQYQIDRVEAANMDMLFLLWGRPKYGVTLNGNGQEVFTVNDINVGRWGEPAALLKGVSSGSPFDFPRPGFSNVDDDGDQAAGYTDNGDPTIYRWSLASPITNGTKLYPLLTPSPLNTVPSFSQPLDFTGGGNWLFSTGANSNGLIAYVGGMPPLPNTPPFNYPPSPARYLIYNNYQAGTSYSSAFTNGFNNNPQALMNNQNLFAGWLPPIPNSPPNFNGVMDEGDEVVIDPRYQQSGDQMFAVDEMLGLHASQADYTAVLGQSRLRQLMALNFDLNQQASLIRKHFTTSSWDRRQHAMGPDARPSTVAANSPVLAANRVWEYGVIPAPAGSGTLTTSGSANYVNNWDGSGNPQFPPMVFNNQMDGSVPALVDTPGASNPTASEPFRIAVAAAIGAKLNNGVGQLGVNLNNASNSNNFPNPNNFNANNNNVNANLNVPFNIPPYQAQTSPQNLPGQVESPWQQQLRLNVNRFLTVANDQPTQTFGWTNPNNPLRYRELTPHPTYQEWVNAGDVGAPIPVSPTGSFVSDSQSFQGNPALQEYWARRDRQQLARDIYVMLYMFGGGADAVPNSNPMTTINYATTSNAVNATLTNSQNPPPPAGQRPLYQDWQLAEMAQFAVNYVDALDRDDTITMFEYDKDLSDGWNLDDNPYPGNPPVNDPIVNNGKPQDRGVVFGVEAQQLAFNEALVIVSRRVPVFGMNNTWQDHPATQLNDSITDRTFTYLELFNVSPYPVPVNLLNWQVVLLDPLGGNTAALNPQQTTSQGVAMPTVPGAAGTALSAVTLKDNQVNSNAAINEAGQILPGQIYTIGSRTYIGGTDDIAPGQPYPSTFVVDPFWTSGTPSPDPAFATPAASQMAPSYNANYPIGSTLNLDLLLPNNVNSFVLTDGTYTGLLQGQFCDMTIGATSPGDVTTGNFAKASIPYATTFTLRRRLNLQRPAPTVTPGNPGEQDNPFVEVDRITYLNSNPIGDPPGAPLPFPGSLPSQGTYIPSSGTFFNLRDPKNDPGASSNPALNDIQPKLMRLVGRERKQPLDGYEGLTSPNTIIPQTWPSTPPPPLNVAPSNFQFTTLYPASRVAYYQSQNLTFPPVGQFTSPNTIGVPNNQAPNPPIPNAPQTFTLWQPHFDRDFASLMELLAIPLYSPSNVTTSLAPKDTSSNNSINATMNTLVSELPFPATVQNFYQPLVAQAKIFRPQHPLNAGLALNSGTPANPLLDNRWHRIFELLEVPTRENMQVENFLQTQYPWLAPQALQRVGAKMNLNPMRYGENLFAMLDDANQFNLTLNQASGTFNVVGYNSFTGSYQDMYEYQSNNTNLPVRDWWYQLLQARDGVDPTASAAYNNANNMTVSLFLPGSPTSRPIRSFSPLENSPYNNQNPTLPLPPGIPPQSIDDTLLKSLPLDNFQQQTFNANNPQIFPPPTTPLYPTQTSTNFQGTAGSPMEQRRLFEARTQADLVSLNQTYGSSQHNTVDFYTQQRLLAKISGNTTPRSNVFIVWLTVGFFEANQPDPVNNPGVVQIGAEMTDQTRRRGFFIVDRSLLEDAWNPAAQTYDFRKFIQYRKTIQ